MQCADTSYMDTSLPDDRSLGRHLDITDLDDDRIRRGADSASGGAGRLWVGIFYECCDAYARVYRRRDEMHYEGRCPECGASVTIRVGPNGIRARILIATPT